MSISRHSDIETLRLNSLEDREKIVTGIFDRRMKQLAKLDSKEEILHECQSLLISRVLDYMNQLDAFDTKYLQQTDFYTQRLQHKEQAIQQLERTVEGLRGELRCRVEQISDFRGMVMEMGIKIEHLVSENQSLLGITKKDEEVMGLNKRVIEGLREKVGELGREIEVLKEEIEYQNEQLESRVEEMKQMTRNFKSQGMKHWNENSNKDEEMGSMRRAMDRLLADKDKQIETLKASQHSLNLKHSRNRLKIQKIEDITVGNRAEPNEDFIRDSKEGTEMTSGGTLRMEVPKEILIEKSKIAHRSSARPTTPLKFFQSLKLPFKENQPSRHCTDDEKSNWKATFKKTYTEAFSQLYRLCLDLKKLSLQRINLALTQKAEIETVIEEMPSKPEDITKIHLLIEDNERLKLAEELATQRAESAFQAMRLCKQDLKRFVETKPIEVNPSPTRTPSQQISQPYSSAGFDSTGKTAESLKPKFVKRRYRRAFQSDNRQEEEPPLSTYLKDILVKRQSHLNRMIKTRSSSFLNIHDRRRRKSR